MSTDPEIDDLPYLLTHIFCPLRLPAGDDHSISMDLGLSQAILSSARAYGRYVSNEHGPEWNHILAMLSNLTATMRARELCGKELESQFESMDVGDVNVYLIRAQNAAVVFRKQETQMLFEAFEVSPKAEAVMGARGKLVCSYPGPAIEVPVHLFENKDFRSELVNFLVHMNHDTIPDALPIAKKAGEDVEETRDTVDPRYVTELLTGILRGVGRPADIVRTSKRIGDDVVWTNSRLPWRRSSLWLVIRVLLQTTLERAALGLHTYKAFMIFFMDELAEKAIEADMSSELLHFMSTKMSRRLMKLGTSASDWLSQKTLRTCTRIRKTLGERWGKVQRSQAMSPSWTPSELDPLKDIQLSLLASRGYISNALMNQGTELSRTSFAPKHPHRGTLQDFLSSDGKFFEDAYHAEPCLTLHDVEQEVERGIDAWLTPILAADVADVEVACVQLETLVENYSSKAWKAYKNNPEELSIMFLTSIELWVALDKLVVKQIPMLEEYSPEVPLVHLERLILRKSESLHRLRLVYKYIRDRHSRAWDGWSVFSRTIDDNSFSVRYYRTSHKLQTLKARVEADAQRVHDEKLEELQRKNARHAELGREIAAMGHTFSGHYHRSWWCSKCQQQQARDSMTIEIHEWPLPSLPASAAMVVFELDCPVSFNMWRSATFHLLADLCSPFQQPESPYILLGDYYALQSYHEQHARSRVTLASNTKPFMRTHYRGVSIPATNDLVCLSNGLNFYGWDQVSKTKTSEPFTKSDNSDMCTYQLPDGAYENLQGYLKGTSHTSNEVIANQEDCHEGLSIHEFIAFGHLRSGSSLQWSNILRELRARTLTFRHNGVHLLLAQAAGQVGHLSQSGEWAWHGDLANPLFCDALLGEIKEFLSSVEANWLEGVTMASVSFLINRLLATNRVSSVQARAHELLREVRKKTFSWVQELSLKVQEVKDEEIRERLRDIAAICRSTFGVDRENTREQLSSQADVEILVTCAITIHDSTPAVLTGIPEESRLLHERDRRLSMILEEILAERIEESSEGMDCAVKGVWNAYQPGSQWRQLDHPNSRWFTCHTAGTEGRRSQEVHFNLLDGALLVEGKPLGTLPREFTGHPIYELIFGSRILDVLPGSIPGMEYTTRGQISDWQVHFAMKRGELQIKAEKDGHLFELIPQGKLKEDIPAPLVKDHAHWLSLSDWTIEIRPLDRLWECRPDNWEIYLAPGAYSMRKGSAMLVDIRSQTWTIISDLLKPLERRDNLLIMSFPYQAFQDIPAPRLVVELPRYGISFFVDDDGDLQSVNMPDMVYDKDQSIGTMFGLVNQLVLRPKSQPEEDLIPRCVLIPHGDVSFKAHGHHVQVNIETHQPSLRRVTYETYKVDTELKCLTGDVSLTNKLYRAYLHAVTSSGCTIDPLTGKTGTEEALSILESASCQSFMKIDSRAAELLSSIGSLVPKRVWYPAHLLRMEDVTWSCLPAAAQHHGLYFAAKSIKKIWERDQILIFREDKDKPLCPFKGFPSPELHLLERASLRAAPLYPRPFSVPVLSEKCDATHASRDLVCGANEYRAYSISSAVGKWSHMQDTVGDILERLKSWGMTLHGDAPRFALRYDKDWLRPDLPEMWLTAYNTCRRSDVRQQWQFQLLFSLAAMAYGSPKCQDLVPTLLAFATIPAFGAIDPPPYESYHLSNEFEPSIPMLRQHISSDTRVLEESPEWSIPRRFFETDSEWLARRCSAYRQRLSSDLDAAVKELLSGWPCEFPPSCRSLSASCYNLSSLANKLDPLFASCYHNLQLKEHLFHVQQILDRARAPAPILQSFTFKPSPGRHTSGAPVVTLGQLFKHPVPHLPCLPCLPLVPPRDDDSEVSSESGGLRQLIDGLRANVKSRFQEQYTEDLRLSKEALCNETYPARPGFSQQTRAVLTQHYTQMRRLYLQCFQVLKQSLDPQLTNEHAVSQSGQWPRITVKAMLQCLASISLIVLPDDWREYLTSFALLVLRLQRSRRLLLHAVKNQHEELFKESLNEGCVGWQAEEHPDWLLIQLEGNFLVRRIQAEIASEMILPQSGQNTAIQLNMGEGKSSVIVPISVAALADRSQLVRVVVPKALAGQMFQLLVERLGGLTNRRIYYLPFSRSLKIGREQVGALCEIMGECMQEGGILVVQPDHLLSLKLMSVEKQLGEHKDVADELLKLQRWLHSHARDILDESDEILHVRYQLLYTMGCQAAVEGSPERWTTTQQVLDLVKKHASSVRDQFPRGMEVGRGASGSFPCVRILQADAGLELVSRIANDVMDGLLPSFRFNQVRSELRDAIRCFITGKDMTSLKVEMVKEYSRNSILWGGLLLLRGLLASGILLFALRERRWRVDYGLFPSRTMLAVPYRAKDSPAPRAEFGHPDVAVMLTCLSYYYNCLTEEQLMSCFKILLKQRNPALEYESWITDLAPHDVPRNLWHVNGINIKSSEQWKQCLVPLFASNKTVVDFYLSRVVFPKETKEFPTKLSCSGWDLAEEKVRITTGFSGTNDGRYLLPTSITQRDHDHQLATNAKVLAYLLQRENCHYMSTTRENGERRTAREFLELLVSQSPEIRVLLDVGAQMLELSNFALATAWLGLKQDAQAAIYFDDDDDELTVYARNGTTQPLRSSPFSQQLGKCVVYLDDAHTRGTDIKFPFGFRAAVTLGPKVTKDRLAQGCMRMRKLGHGHSVMFFAPREVDQSIRSVSSKDDTDVIDAADILRWTILETCEEIQHRAPQWAQQGVDHASRYDAWSSYCGNEFTSQQLAEAWLQPEAKSLETLYAPAQSDGQLDTSDPLIQQRLADLGIPYIGLSGMDEEQEREVVYEIEQENQPERPPKLPVESHRLHHDVETFVQLGSIPQGSTAFLKVFESLKNTSAAFTEPDRWTDGVFATADFCNTVKLGPGAKADEYLRAVNWVISSHVVQPPILVVVSPYEAHQLLPKIRFSKTVHLHIYTPRTVQSMRPCDDLKLYSIPAVPDTWTASLFPQVVDHLNVFAGQLYLRDYKTYIQLCRFLCLQARDLEADGDFTIQSDGFIKPEDRPPRALGSFQESPIPSLKKLFGLRTKGMLYAPTHMGKILDAQLLTEDDFRDQISDGGRNSMDSTLCK
ncbi:hypothetical protein PAXRUDRAFT_14327 [Paxillus rubicundulus Ve08.2h10]|uniref:ubiquitinyl hydrolase 1 n=1 Tax=Paxillus rubicundulus Ve08.2h10 TaxID=930991 RepID=A0A0D0E1L7_9AGAM|nr:hypothetical protein PAXRUDRAFT_14327 [Paxillus rubicundulus Ve08.2h10]